MGLFGNLFDLAQDGVERVLQRPVEFVPLRRPELVEVGIDAFARPFLVFAVSAAQILDDFLTSENRLGELVEHGFWPATITSYRPIGDPRGSL
jgi:hypothetical protein